MAKSNDGMIDSQTLGLFETRSRGEVVDRPTCPMSVSCLPRQLPGLIDGSLV